MYYDYQRWYDPSIGRFISQDPLPGQKSNPQTLNPYVYVLDSPTSLTDPSGMDGGFLGPFDQYVSGPYLDWFNSNVEVPVLTFECGCNRAVVEEAVNQNAGLEKTLFDVGVVSGVVIASAAILTPYVLGTIAPTALGACEEDPEACEPPPTPTEPTPTIPTTGSQGTSVFYRYVTTSELQDLQENPVLSPGESGRVYFTDQVYDSQSVSYNRLSLYELKDYRIAFSFTGNPDITGPGIVQPRFTSAGEIITEGGGIEYFIREIATIKLIGVPVPLGP